jgi:hypothetical protein
MPAVAQQAPAQARWASGFGQGTSEAMIHASENTYLASACPSVRPDAAPSISVQIDGRPPSSQAALQIEVDGRTFTIALSDGSALGRDQSTATPIVSVAQELVRSRAQSFTAAIPAPGWRQQFAFANVQETLGAQAGRTIVDGCLR